MQRRKILNIIYALIGLLSLIAIIIAGYMFLKMNKYVAYKDPQGRISIKYPADWTYKENAGGAAVVFLTPKQSEVDSFNENVNIVIQDLSDRPMSIAEYSDLAIRQMQIIFRNFVKIKKAEPMLLDRKDGFQFVFIGKGSETEPDLKFKSVWTIHKGFAYQITYTANLSQYELFIEQVDKMISSFDIK